MKRLLIVADHSLVVEGIRLALRQTAGFQIVGFVDGRQPIGSVVAQVQPDVVLVDDMREHPLALDRLAEISEAAPQAKCLLLTLDMEPAWLDGAFRAGAHAAISKAVHPASLGTLLRETARDNVVHRFTAAPVTAGIEHCPLTHRELEVLRSVAQGHTNSRIARDLWVTEQTVKFHLSNTYRKLGVSNRTEASRYAHLHRLLDGPLPATLPQSVAGAA